MAMLALLGFTAFYCHYPIESSRVHSVSQCSTWIRTQ